MKKLLALLLAMILCLGVLASCNSEKANDSVDLPRKESSLARTTMFDSVIKISSYESLPKTIADDLNVRAIFYDYYIVHPLSINLLTKDKYYDYNGNYIESYYIGNQLTVSENMEISDTYLEAENVLIMYKLTDIFNQSYWTEPLKR